MIRMKSLLPEDHDPKLSEAGWNADQWKKAMDRTNKWKKANPALANAKRAAKEKENPQLRKQTPLPVPAKTEAATKMSPADQPTGWAKMADGSWRKTPGGHDVKEAWPEPWRDSKTCAQCGGPIAKMAPTAQASVKMCPKCSKLGVKEATDPSSTFRVIDRPTPPLPDRYKYQAKPDDPAGRWYVVDGNGHPAGFWEYKARSKEAMRKKAEAKAAEWTAQNNKQHARLTGTKAEGRSMRLASLAREAAGVSSGYTKKALIRGPDGMYLTCPCGTKVNVTGDRNVCKSCGTEFNSHGWIKNPKLEATGRPRPWDSPSQVAKKKLATKVVPEARLPQPKEALEDYADALDHVADQLEDLYDKVGNNKDLLKKAIQHARYAYEYCKNIAEKY